MAGSERHRVGKRVEPFSGEIRDHSMENKHETQEEVWWHKYVPKEQRTISVELPGTEQAAAVAESADTPAEIPSAMPAPATAPENKIAPIDFPSSPPAGTVSVERDPLAPLSHPALPKLQTVGDSIVLAPQPIDSAPVALNKGIAPGPEGVLPPALEPAPKPVTAAPDSPDQEPVLWNPVWKFDSVSAPEAPEDILPLAHPEVSTPHIPTPPPLHQEQAPVELLPLLNEDDQAPIQMVALLPQDEALIEPLPLFQQPQGSMDHGPEPAAQPEGLGTLLFGSKTSRPVEDLPLVVDGSTRSAGSPDISLQPSTGNAVLRSLLQTKWLLLVPAVALVALLAGLLLVLTGDDAIEGQVEETTQPVVAEESGIVGEILVKSWDQVKKGDDIARLRSDDVDGEIETLETQLRVRYEKRFIELNQKITELNKFLAKSDIDHAAMQQENTALAQLVRELEKTAAPGSEAPPLASGGRTAERRSELIENIAKNHAKITTLEGAVTLAQQDIQEMMNEVESLQQGDHMDLAGLDEQLHYKNLLKKRERLTLKSQVDGTVARIHFSAGESITRGAPLAEVLTAPRTITLSLPSKIANRCHPEDEVWVEEPGGGYLPTKILSVAPEFSSTGEDSQGRKAYAQFPLQSNHKAGQRVLVHLTDPRLPGFKRFTSSVARSFD